MKKCGIIKSQNILLGSEKISLIVQGCINIWIDKIVPCLIDTETEEVKETVVFKIESRAYLKKFKESNPHNNKHDFGIQKYEGVGGHLFAIGADKSIEWGYDGAMHGFAANKELLEHYIKVFGAEYLGMLHEYQFFIDENEAQKLREVYNYEWNDT